MTGNDTPPTSAPGEQETQPSLSDLEVPARIGPYTILRILGEGGMGVVYLARQETPIRREVALKLVKLGMDTERVIARFESERQTLAILSHRNVAKVFDAGVTERGRPYFVMEYVPGVTLNRYCDEHRLTNPQRLGLFVQVCGAIQHAHQKGIIHRDVKPSNVLVTEEEGTPVPKVIDFGIAKATGAGLSERSLLTRHGALLGTPAYMSPEQAETSGLDIDTRSDVYSLGVVLYELLVGSLPFTREKLRGVSPDEASRKIREEEPERPSTHVGTLTRETRKAAELRRVDLPTLRRQLRGDLDWIVMRAVEKDRNRRYQAASELAADIERYLRHEPVVAGPPGAAYRLKKFARRNRGALTGASLVALALVAGMVGTTLGLLKAKAEARRARTEAAIAEAVNDFLNDDLLAAVAPYEQGIDVSMRDVLAAASERIDRKFENQPLVEAATRATLGRTYKSLGEYPAAELHLRRARDLVAQQLGKEHPDTLRADQMLADLFTVQGRYEEAKVLFENTLRTQKRVLGDEDPATLVTMRGLAVLYDEQGRYDEAEALYLQVVETQRQVLGEEHPSTLISMNDLANLYDHRARYDEAEALHVQVLDARRRVFGKEHPSTLASLANLGALHRSQGRYDEAEPLFVEVLETRRTVLGEEHPATLTSMAVLAQLLGEQGRFEEAETLFRSSIDAMRRVLGDEHPTRLSAINNLTLVLKEQDRLGEAEPLYVEVLEIRRRVLGEDHPRTLTSMHNLAALYRRQGRYDEAEPLMKRTLETERRRIGEEHPDTLISMVNLARLYREMSRYEEAEALQEEVLATQRRTLGETHRDTLISMHELALICGDQGRYDEAADLQARLVALARDQWPEGHWFQGAFLSAQGRSLSKLLRWEQAEAALLESVEIFAGALGEDDHRTAAAVKALIQLYDDWGRADQADAWRARKPSP